MKKNKDPMILTIQRIKKNDPMMEKSMENIEKVHRNRP